MGTISTGVGLISGLDIENIVTQLLAVESRPKDLLQTRIDDIDRQQQAMMEVQAQVMAVKLAASTFNSGNVFQQKSATSSDEDVLGVSATRFAVPGSYQFTVNRLAATHQAVSRGYSSLESSIGVGQFTLEIGQGQLNRDTELGFINGQRGFDRGKIEITDRSGKTAEIDLSTALSIQDVLDEINRNSTVNVTASVSGGSIVLTDNTGGTDDLVVSEVGSGTTAESLGFSDLTGRISDTVLQGSNIIWLTDKSRLLDLNDGNGIRGLESGLDDIKFTLRDESSFSVDLKGKLHETIGDPDASTRIKALNSGLGVRTGTFRITDQNGRRVDIDLTELGDNPTLGQLKAHIEQKAADKNMSLTVAFGSLDHIEITDNSKLLGDSEEKKGQLIIEDLEGGSAAADLGIVGDVSHGKITGERIWRMDTLGDVVSSINNHWDNDGSLTVEINTAGTGLTVSDYSALEGTLIVESVNGSSAAEDLGILSEEGSGDYTYDGRRLVAGLNSTLLRSLNGGYGGDEANRITDGGTITINGTDIDLTANGRDLTTQDVIDAINSADITGVTVTASMNAVGNGILLTEESGANITVSGDLADKLNLSGTGATLNSGNLQLQYVSEATLLDDLRQGQGIRLGAFEITDGDGRKATINLDKEGMKTIGDVIRQFEINNPTNIRARINDTGDGILLYDDISTGDLTLTAADVGGYSARDLGIHGVAESGDNFIDGSYELRLDVGGGDTLEDVVSMINEAGMGVTASLINDGSSSSPYRLSLNGDVSGRSGRFYLDAGETTLDARTLSQGEDAIVFFGGSRDSALMVSSDSNTLDDVIKGTTLELLETSDTPVEVTIAQDLDGVVHSMETFVDAYNSAMVKLNEVDNFNAETLERSVLFGDSTVGIIRRNLETLVHQVVSNVGSFRTLGEVGIKFSALGTQSITDANGETKSFAVAGTPQLSFNETTFRAAMGVDPDGVKELFTHADTGIGDYLRDTLERLAGTYDSSIRRSLDAMDSREKLFKKRIENLDVILSAKEQRLYNDFYAMEQALAAMQSQQSALSSLSTLTSN